MAEKRKYEFGKQFPVMGIYEPMPAALTLSAGASTVYQVVQVLRWAGRIGHEGIVNFAFSTNQVPVGPIPGLQVQVFNTPANVVKGSYGISAAWPNCFSTQEAQTKGNAVTLSTILGNSLGVPGGIPLPWSLVRNAFVPKDRQIMVALSYRPSMIPDQTKIWGYLFGTSWPVGTLNKEEISRVAQQLKEATF